MNRRLFLSLLILLASVGLYLPTLEYPFIYDSQAQILIDPFLHDFSNLKSILTLEVLRMDLLDFNRPGVLLSLMGDVFLWGKNPAGYRLTSLLLHGAVAALLFRWLLALLGPERLFPALLPALLFAVHPLNVETVVEASYREDLLVAFFLLVGMLAATAFNPSGQTPLKKWSLGLGIVASLFLAATSKETGVVGPVMLLLYWFLFRRKESGTIAWGSLLVASFAACGGFYAARFLLAPETSLIFTHKPGPIAPDLLTLLKVQSRIWTAESLRIFWPFDLSPTYSGYTIRNLSLGLSLTTLAATLLVQAWASWKSPLFALGAALFWLGLLPVSNLIPIYQAMADRFLYLPLLGIAAMLGAAITTFDRPPIQNLWRLLSVPAGAALVILLSVITLRQEKLWESSLKLWTAAQKMDPTNYTPYSGIGWAYLDMDKPKEAILPFVQAAQTTKEQYFLPFIGLALALQEEGRLEEAITLYKKAESLDARTASPDALTKALILRESIAAKLKLLQLRSRQAANP